MSKAIVLSVRRSQGRFMLSCMAHLGVLRRTARETVLGYNMLYGSPPVTKVGKALVYKSSQH